MSGALMQTRERPLLVSHVLSMEGDWVWVTRLPAGTVWQYPGTPSLAGLLSPAPRPQPLLPLTRAIFS